MNRMPAVLNYLRPTAQARALEALDKRRRARFHLATVLCSAWYMWPGWSDQQRAEKQRDADNLLIMAESGSLITSDEALLFINMLLRMDLEY